MTSTKTTRRAGDVHTWDNQSCIWGTQYKLVERVPGKPGRWVIEHLAPSGDVLGRIFDDYAAHEAVCQPGCTRCMYHAPIWDKTWAQCTGDEAPQRVGWTTVAQELDRELARLAARAGTRSEIQFVSRAAYDRHF